MLGFVKVAIGGLTSGVAGRWEGEAKFTELDRLIPVYIAHFQRLRVDLSLPDGHPLLATAARMIAECKEACEDYRRRIEANRSSRVTEAVDTAKELAGGVVGIRYWESRFSELLTKMQSLVVASLTLTAESAATTSPPGSHPDTDAPLLQYLAHCFSLVRLECEVPKPPRPADTRAGFPGFVWTGDDAPYSGRLDVQWERPPGPRVGFDGGCDLDADVNQALYRSRPRRYQLWCERSFDVIQGSLDQLRQLGVYDFLEPSAIGLGRHVMEIESEQEVIVARMVGQSEGLAAGTKYSMAVRSWLNPPPGCATAWSKWSDWSSIGCTSPTHHVVTDLRCVAASERGLLITWVRPTLAEHATSRSATRKQAQQTNPPGSESREFAIVEPEPEPEPEPIHDCAAVEWEYEVRMERTGARQAVQTLQAKVAGTFSHLFSQAGVWQREEGHADVEADANTDAETKRLHRPVTADGEQGSVGSDSVCRSEANAVDGIPAPAAKGEINHPRGGRPGRCAAGGPSLVPDSPQIHSSTGAGVSGVWDAVGGDRTQQMEVQQRLEAAEHSREKLEAALLEAATILPDEHAVIRGTVRSKQLAVTFCAGEAVAAAASGAVAQGDEHRTDDGCAYDRDGLAESAMLRAGSIELAALEAGLTYRVSVRARPCPRPTQAAPVTSVGQMPGADAFRSSLHDAGECEWGGWCPMVDMQTLPAEWNPPPEIDFPVEGWEVTIGEGCEIMWSWPAVAEAASRVTTHSGHARAAVREILFTSQSGFHRYSIPLPVSTQTLCLGEAPPDADADFSWDWDGRLWPSAMPDLPDSRIYIDSPSPQPFTVFVYLRFVGVDGMETYTAARRLLMLYPPLLQINAPPTGQRVSDYTAVGANGHRDHSQADDDMGLDYDVASVTAGDPVAIRWEMIEGVTVSHITLKQRSKSWLSSLPALTSASPVITLATATTTAVAGDTQSLAPTSTSYHWSGRLPVTIVDSSAEHNILQGQEPHRVGPDGCKTSSGEVASVDGDSLDFIEADLGMENRVEGAVPTGGQYDIVVHCVAPPELGGAEHGIVVPIDLDEPFEIIAPPQPSRPAPVNPELSAVATAATATTASAAAATPAAGSTRQCENDTRAVECMGNEGESASGHVQIQLPLSPGSRPLHI